MMSVRVFSNDSWRSRALDLGRLSLSRPTPRPGFFILGSKSYGRQSSFLLKIGHEQVRALLGGALSKLASA